MLGENEAMKATALNYWKQGMNIVLLLGKRPLHEWKHWRGSRQSKSDFEVLPWNKAESFAVIAGSKLANGLYICAIDFDIKNVTLPAIEKGKKILKRFRTTQIEETINGGQHWIYQSRVQPKTISVFHNEAALELLGEGKLCIMAPSKGYRRLNDNTPTVVRDIEASFFSAFPKKGIESQCRLSKECIRSRSTETKPYIGKEPPCIHSLIRGARQGIRNETGIRIAAFLLNFKNMLPEKAWTVFSQWNGQNEPPLDSQELHAIFNSALREPYDFGCEDPLLSHFCKEEKCSVFQRKMRAFNRKVATL